MLYFCEWLLIKAVLVSFFGKGCPSFSCWLVVTCQSSHSRDLRTGHIWKRNTSLNTIQYFSHRHGFELWSSQIEEIWYDTMNTGQKVWLKSNNCGAMFFFFFFFFEKQPCYKLFIYLFIFIQDKSSTLT